MCFNTKLEKTAHNLVENHLCCKKGASQEAENSSAVQSSTTTVDMTQSKLIHSI